MVASAGAILYIETMQHLPISQLNYVNAASLSTNADAFKFCLTMRGENIKDASCVCDLGSPATITGGLFK